MVYYIMQQNCYQKMDAAQNYTVRKKMHFLHSSLHQHLFLHVDLSYHPDSFLFPWRIPFMTPCSTKLPAMTCLHLYSLSVFISPSFCEG